MTTFAIVIGLALYTWSEEITDLIKAVTDYLKRH